MEMIIGRDSATGRLKAVIGQQPFLGGEQGSVPRSVSRQHCSLIRQEDGKYLLQNLKVENTTYVNGLSVEKKAVTENDRIELGEDHYLLRWDIIKKMMPAGQKVVDIRPLKKVWDNYETFKLQQSINERKFNNQRQAIGLLTMGAMVLGILTGRSSLILLPIYALAISIGVIFFIKAHKKATAIPIQNKEEEKRFIKKYSCPACGHYMGVQPYEVLRQNNGCPYCQAKFKP